jgi:hypothetical protein
MPSEQPAAAAAAPAAGADKAATKSKHAQAPATSQAAPRKVRFNVGAYSAVGLG